MITTLILAGGLGSRLGELTKIVPKPLVEICGKPISLHLVEYLQLFEVTNFIFAIGYKKEHFHNYFRNLFNNSQDMIYSTDYPNGRLVRNIYEKSSFRLIDTGLYSQTGSRIAKVFDLIKEDNILCTYGDGLANIDIKELISKHKKNKTLITLTAVRTPSRFGGLSIKDNRIIKFSEKKVFNNNWINGGFMIISREFRDKYLSTNEDCILEQIPLETAAKNNDLGVYQHNSFWQCMDTPRDHSYLEDLYKSNKIK